MLKILSIALQKDETGSAQEVKVPSVSKMLGAGKSEGKIALSVIGDEDYVMADAVYRVYKQGSVIENKNANDGYVGCVEFEDGFYHVFESKSDESL